MSENAPFDHKLEQLRLLFDYTKFHIGLYSTIAGVLVATLALKQAETWPMYRWALGLAILSVVIAGLAGGVIAASLPSLTDSPNFWDAPTGPYASELLTVRQWTYIEHTAFWAAVMFVLIAFAPALRK